MTGVPPALEARFAALNAKPVCTPQQLAFIDVMGDAIAEAGVKIKAALPAGQYDAGRAIAATDALLHARDVYIASVKLAALTTSKQV